MPLFRAAEDVDDLVPIVERAAEMLLAGGHQVDPEELREAVETVEARVFWHVGNGASLDAAVGAVDRELADRVSTRALQGRDPAEALHDLAVAHALDGWPLPARWRETAPR